MANQIAPKSEIETQLKRQFNYLIKPSIDEFAANKLKSSSKIKSYGNDKDHVKFIISCRFEQVPSMFEMSFSITSLILCLMALILPVIQVHSARMVRLCIASVDPVKLSSQCVMCSRREFPMTAIDCTGITKMNDLISNPLSVQEATCLIYNCRQQVPDVKPEPYHGSVSHAARANYASASGTRSYGMLPPSSVYEGYNGPPPIASYADYGGPMQNDASISAAPSLSPTGSFGGASSLLGGRQQALPYALVPTSYSSPFGMRKYKAALVPLFR